MKYYLRSAVADQQTNELSTPYPEIQHSRIDRSKKKNKKKGGKTKKVQKKNKNKPLSPQKRARRLIVEDENNKKRPFHQKILRFPLKYKKKTLRVYLYNESDLGIKKRFAGRFIEHKRDDDQSSWSSLIEGEVERCTKDLFDSFRKYSQSKSQLNGGSQVKPEVQSQSVKSSRNKTIEIAKKGKRRISKRPKNKRNS